jgi:RNA polymerase sigma-70 factor (ECF subfamily)
MTGNDDDAADAAQEALLAVTRGLPRFDGRSAFSTWSYRIAVNASLDELRRRKRRPGPALPDPVERPAAGGAPGFDTSLADRLAIDAALAALSPEFRAAVVLRDVADLDYAEIADVLDIPPGTVRSRIARGRAALAERLAGNHGGATERPTPRP